MKKQTVGVILLCVLAVAGIGIYKLTSDYLFKKRIAGVGDAKITATVRIGGDGYFGYWFITSPETVKESARRGLAIEWTDDKGNYAERLQKFAAKEYDMIVLPVSSYLEHGSRHSFPGVMVAVVAESKGADGIVALKSKVPSGNVKDLNNPALRWVLTGDSPSEFLADLTVTDFDLFNLAGSTQWKVPVGGSTEVLDKLRKKQGDVFVLWEPELSKALAESDVVPIWDTSKFSGYVVDVFVVHKDFLIRQESTVKKFFEAYYMAQRTYSTDRARMIAEMRKSSGLKETEVENVLKKIDFYDLYENCARGFGIELSPGSPTREGVADTILACADILVRTKKLPANPLRSPYDITDRNILDQLRKESVGLAGSGGVAVYDFPPLDDAGWEKLKTLGAIRIEPISFDFGAADLNDEAKRIVDEIGRKLTTNYPSTRVAIRGHTSPGDNEEAAKLLSQQRAEAVFQRLAAVAGIDRDRMRAEGFGSTQPPEKRPNENPRAFNMRKARVEIVLFEENQL